MHRASLLALAAGLALLPALACGGGEEEGGTSGGDSGAGTAGGPTLDRGLMLALSPFEVTPEGEVEPKPQAARLEFLVLREGQWQMATAIDDPDSNVFHKAMVYRPPGREPGILTLGGSAAILKLWRPDGSGETLWEKDFGGRFSRMRDAEAGDLYGDGVSALAVATHDQGVVATVRPDPEGGWTVEELDQEADTFVHEIEIGDLDADGTREVYATPSEPNRLDGSPQPGKVVRYVPGRGEGRAVVADLGQRHAKEILVADVDGDGTDELYVSVEGETKGTGRDARLVEPVEIRRYEADTDPTGGAVIARLEGERLTRFLTAGDVEGDGQQEIVAASFKKGLWLLRPGEDPTESWRVTSIDRRSGGFEHAAILTDLDGDGADELYVASDDDAEVRRYVWNGRSFDREVIHERIVHGHKVPGAAFTWNLMQVPVELIPEE